MENISLRSGESDDEYVHRRIDEADDEERASWSSLSRKELADMLLEEYEQLLDAQSGQLEIENAEIEAVILAKSGEKKH